MPAPKFRERLAARLLDIAERVLAEEGLAAVQARRITSEADCAVGTLYNIYGDLDALIVCVHERTLRLLGASLEIASRGAARAAPADRLMALALAYRDFAVVHRHRWKALFQHVLPDGQEVPASYEAQQGELLGLIERCLADHVADAGELRTAARSLFGSAHGIITLALEGKLGGATDAELEAQLRFLVESTARGLDMGKF